MALDRLQPTMTPGVFYVEHPKRKYGVRKDRQFVLRYTIKGKTRKEIFGWESEGFTVAKAEEKIRRFRRNAGAGQGPVSLREEKEAESLQYREAERRREEEEKEERRRNTTLDQYFFGPYMEAAKASKKSRTVAGEVSLYRKWIQPDLGGRPIRSIKYLDFKRLEKSVLAGGLAPRTVHYCVSIITQVWNMAFDHEDVGVQPPRRNSLDLPMIDNERTRAFTHDEATLYFEEMKRRSPLWHEITLVSLFAGLRASEIFRLEVENFDEERRRLFLRTPKKQKSQYLPLNDTAFEVLRRLKDEHPTGKGLFFPSRNGAQIKEVSDTVQRVIDGLGFNKGVADRRDKLTFHSWRHTYATWLLDGGTDIYTVSQLLRHNSLATTRKYVHPHEERLRAAARGLDRVFRPNWDVE